MCFVHSGSAGSAGSAGGGSLVQQTALGAAAATAFSTLAAGGAVGGMDVAAGSPDVVTGPGGARVVDGYGQILHTRWNRDLPPAGGFGPAAVDHLFSRHASTLSLGRP